MSDAEYWLDKLETAEKAAATGNRDDALAGFQTVIRHAAARTSRKLRPPPVNGWPIWSGNPATSMQRKQNIERPSLCGQRYCPRATVIWCRCVGTWRWSAMSCATIATRN